MSDTGSQESLDFLRNMWGGMGMNIPNMVTPTLDIKELDKRITDLKAVEGWLSMNLNMLKMSIQGLEMQRNTLATMQSFAQSVQAPSSTATPEQTASPMSAAQLWPWGLMQQATQAVAAAAANATQAATQDTTSPTDPATPTGSAKPSA